ATWVICRLPAPVHADSRGGFIDHQRPRRADHMDLDFATAWMAGRADSADSDAADDIAVHWQTDRGQILDAVVHVKWMKVSGGPGKGAGEGGPVGQEMNVAERVNGLDGQFAQGRAAEPAVGAVDMSSDLVRVPIEWRITESARAALR